MIRHRPLVSVLLAATLALAAGARAESLDIGWRAPGATLERGAPGDPSSSSQAIAPGRSLTLRLPPSVPLRWRVTQGDATHLSVTVAEDGDLFRAVDAGAAPGGYRWLPPSSRVRRVALANGGDGEIVIEAWTGELFEPAAPALRVLLDAEGATPARWRMQPSRDVGHGVFAPRDGALRFAVQGPARVELESFSLVDAVDAKPAWSLATALDDEPARTWHLLAPVDRAGTRNFAGETRLASTTRSLFLDIPAGSHTLAVSANAGVVVRAYTGRGLLFADNITPAFPRRDVALARTARFQAARESVIGGDPSAADADWRALDPVAALLLTRARGAFDIEPLGDGPLAFGWSLDPDTGAGARLTWLEPGTELAWQVPAALSRVELEASGENGTRLVVRRAGAAEEFFLRIGDGDDVPRGRAMLEVGGGEQLSVVADRPVLVRLRGALPRDPGLAPVPGDRGAIDLAYVVAHPERAPSWFAPLAERLAGRLVGARGTAPACRERDDALPGDWRARTDDFITGQRPDEAARLLARARLLCAGGEEAGDRLAALLRDAGEYRAWALLRLDDVERRSGDGLERVIDELRSAWRAQESWSDLEILGARRAAAGDPRAWGLIGEALVQQGEDGATRALCGAMSARDVRPDTPLLARACAEAALQHTAVPWAPLAAIDGTAGGLRTLENVATGQRASRFLARDDAPLALRVEGPATLRVEARRLLDAGETMGAAGWIAAKLDDDAWHLPLDAGAASAEWRVAASRRLPGQPRRFNLVVPPGVHRVTLQGDGELLFGVSAADTSWFSVLPATAVDGAQPVDEPALDDSDIGNLPTVDDTSDHHLLRLAWWAEHAIGAKQRGLRARLHALAARQAPTPWRQRLLARVDRDYGWQRESRVIDSAGLRYRDDVAGGSPPVRLRRALLDVPTDDAFAAGGAWLAHDSAPGMLVDGAAWQRVRVQARQYVLPGGSAAPASVTVYVDDRPAGRLAAAVGATASVEIAPGAGLHRVVMRLDDPAPDVSVQARLEAFDGRRWQALSLQGDRAFLVSRADTPVRVAVDAAEWLRVDELDGARLRTRYVFQPVAGIASIAPENDSEATLRVWSLREDPHPLPPSAQPPVTARPSLSRGRAAAMIAALDAPVAWTLTADRGDSPATDADDQLYVRGDWNVEANEDGAVRGGDAGALGWLHRERLAKPGLWWRSDLFGRALEGPDSSAGTSQLLEWHPAARAWYAQLEGEAFDLLADAGGDEQAAALTARWRLEHDLDRALVHRVGVEAFTRWHSADAVRGATIADADVWTPWKDDHRHGLRFNERWRWQPVEDAAVQLDYGLNGNETFADPLDSLWVEPSARIWWRGLALDASLRWQRFVADDDRADAYERRSFGIDAQWHRWRARGGWFLEAGWRRELDTRIDSVTLGGGWSWGAGPRAYPPSELPFRSLEERVFDRANAHDRLATDTAHAGR